MEKEVPEASKKFCLDLVSLLQKKLKQGHLIQKDNKAYSLSPFM